MNKYIFSFLKVVKKSVPLALAAVMLFNISTEALAQAISKPGKEKNSPFLINNKRTADMQSFSFGPINFLGQQALDKFDAEKFRVNTKFLTISGTLSYEAYKKEIKKDAQIAALGNLEEEVFEELYFAYKSALVSEEDAVTAAYNHIKKTHSYRVEDSYYVANEKKYKNAAGQICDNGKCFEEIIYNRGSLRAHLRYGAGLDDNTNKKWQWNGEIMLSNAKPIYYMVMENGVAGSDVAFAQKYFRFLIEKTGDFCDNDFYVADVAPGLAGADGRGNASRGKERRKEECIKLGYITLALAAIENAPYSDKVANADLIYKQLKSNYREDYGPIVLGNYVTALLMLGTSNAFTHLEKFILEESLADGLRNGSIWQKLGKVFDIISIKAWVDSFTDTNNRIRGRGGRYLNEAGLRFQYVDDEAASEMGYSEFSVRLAKDGHSGYNVPYGNIFEDIGELLSRYPDNRARAIAAKAVKKYANSVKTGDVSFPYVHNPLVLGAIKGGGVPVNDEVRLAINKIYQLDWWDLNEGTQRRINNAAAKMSPYYGAGEKALKSKDQIKINRASRNNTIGQLAVWSDLLISALLITTFIASIPALARGSVNFVKTIQTTRAVRVARISNIKAAGKANLLKNVRAGIKTSGVKPAQVKSALKAKAAATPKPTVKPAAAATNAAKKTNTASIVKKHKAVVSAQNSAAIASKQTQNAKNAKTLVAPSQTHPSTAQILLVEQNAKIVPQVGHKATTLTATVGEGGGGAAASSVTNKFTKAQRLFHSQQEAAYELRLAEEVTELMAPVKSAPFKGGWFFNKPYSQLPKWKQTILTQYMWRVLPALDLSKQAAFGAARNPLKAVSGLSVTGAPSAVQIFNPTVIVAPVSNGVRTSFTTSYALTQPALGLVNNVGTAAKTSVSLSNTAKAASAADLLKASAPLGTKPFTLITVPQLEGVLNEFHGGPSGSANLKGTVANRGALVLEAITATKKKKESIRRKYASKEEKNNYISFPKAQRKFEWKQQENLATASVRNVSAVTPLAYAPVLNVVPGGKAVFDAKGNGFDAFEKAFIERSKKQTYSKANKARHDQLLAVSRYISPRLAKELLAIVDVNPEGYAVFDTFFEYIADAIPFLKGNEIITIGFHRIPNLKNGVLEDYEVRNLLEIQDNPFDDMFLFAASSANFMVTSAKARVAALSAEQKHKVLESLTAISLQKDQPGAPGNSYLVGTTGDAYEWENFSADNTLNLALGKEIRRDLVKEFSTKKGKINYKQFLNKHKDWIIEKLGATMANPAVLFENAEGTYFIYSHDGKARIRVGGHELLLSRKVNYHFHLEYLNAVDGTWTGPVNYTCRWFTQDLLPSEAVRDMIEAPIEYMMHRGLLIEKSKAGPSPVVKAPQQNPQTPVLSVSPGVKTDTYVLTPTEIYSSAIKSFVPTQYWANNYDITTQEVINLSTPDYSMDNLVAEVQPAQTPDWLLNKGFMEAVPSTDPLVLASFMLFPFFKKSGLKTGKEQSFSSVMTDIDTLLLDSEDGFGLTYVDASTGKEIVLPVNLTITGRIPAKGYNRVVFNEKGIAELRNHDKTPVEMSHFYMKFDNSEGKFGNFVKAIVKADLGGNFKIKIEDKPNKARKIISTTLFDSNGAPLPISVEIDAKLLPNGHLVVLTEDGKIGHIKTSAIKNNGRIRIIDANIRLPKNQIPNMVKILNNSGESYNITIAPTQQKATVIIRDVSLTNVSLGKTFAPVVKGSLGMSEADATTLMFCLNYLMPGLSSFLNPILQKFGEKKVLLTSLLMSTFAGLIAVSAGFYGTVSSTAPSMYRTYAFAAAVVLMASAGILKQLVSNMLIRANRGDTSDKKAGPAKTAAQIKAEAKAAEHISTADLMKRLKAVFNSKGKTSLHDAFFYNLSFIWKNAGTLMFLALPYIVNESIKLVSGYDAGLDFSLSFPLYALYSGMTTYKVYQSNLRDAYERQAKAPAAKDAASDPKKAGTDQAAPAVAAEKEFKGVLDVFKHAKGVWPVSIGMVFATVHEFVLSSSFASTLNAVFDDGEAANFWVALCLYVPLVFGRLFIGNIVGQRISSSSLYMLSTILSGVGTAMMINTESTILTMAGASIASLGVGNFFTQMYDYITSKHRRLNREISVILALTMTVAALMSTPVRYIAEASSIQDIDLMFAIGCLGISLGLTMPMLKESSITKFIMQRFYKGKNKVKEFRNNKGKKGGDQNNGNQTPPVDMNNPLPN